jgi:hypothetical protein
MITTSEYHRLDIAKQRMSRLEDVAARSHLVATRPRRWWRARRPPRV